MPRETLSSIEARLGPEQFSRVNRSRRRADRPGEGAAALAPGRLHHSPAQRHADPAEPQPARALREIPPGRLSGAPPMEQAKLETPGAPSSRPRARRRPRGFPALALSLLAPCVDGGGRGRAWRAPFRSPATSPATVSAGLSGWRDGDYRQSTGNLFFAQKWAAWPLYRSGDCARPTPRCSASVQWNPLLIGEVLLFSGPADPRAILEPARRMTLALCLLSGVLVWGWASWLGRALGGGPGGAPLRHEPRDPGQRRAGDHGHGRGVLVPRGSRHATLGSCSAPRRSAAGWRASARQ